MRSGKRWLTTGSSFFVL
ncbi:MAG: KxYKxGKxW signal peptide domain-containing protein [Leptospirillum sp.]